jgi:hypothetical protein
MSSSVARLFTVLVLAGALLGAAPASSQTGRQPAAKPAESEPSTVTKVQQWTQKQWSEMTQEWRKDRVKWDGCNKRAAAQKLKGQESWTYIYGCMKG